MSSLVVDWTQSLEEIEGNRSAQQLTDLDEAHFLRVGWSGFGRIRRSHCILLLGLTSWHGLRLVPRTTS